jgi:hypothetical protein
LAKAKENSREKGGGEAPRGERKFWNAILVVLMAVCIYSGPYAVFMLYRVLKHGLLFSTVSGVGLFAIGMVLLGYLIKKKVIT